MKSTKFLIAAIAASAAAVVNVYAADEHAQHNMQSAGTTQVAGANAMVMTAGQVRKVDAEQGKITIQHEPITNLDMPAMTMVFRADKDVLGGVKAGDKVQFHAESRDGNIAVTHIQAQK